MKRNITQAGLNIQSSEALCDEPGYAHFGCKSRQTIGFDYNDPIVCANTPIGNV
jgi:hypothetical protein